MQQYGVRNGGTPVKDGFGCGSNMRSHLTSVQDASGSEAAVRNGTSSHESSTPPLAKKIEIGMTLLVQFEDELSMWRATAATVFAVCGSCLPSHTINCIQPFASLQASWCILYELRFGIGRSSFAAEYMMGCSCCYVCCSRKLVSPYILSIVCTHLARFGRRLHASVHIGDTVVVCSVADLNARPVFPL